MDRAPILGSPVQPIWKILKSLQLGLPNVSPLLYTREAQNRSWAIAIQCRLPPCSHCSSPSTLVCFLLLFSSISSSSFFFLPFRFHLLYFFLFLHYLLFFSCLFLLLLPPLSPLSPFLPSSFFLFLHRTFLFFYLFETGTYRYTMCWYIGKY